MFCITKSSQLIRLHERFIQYKKMPGVYWGWKDKFHVWMYRVSDRWCSEICPKNLWSRNPIVGGAPSTLGGLRLEGRSQAVSSSHHISAVLPLHRPASPPTVMSCMSGLFGGWLMCFWRCFRCESTTPAAWVGVRSHKMVARLFGTLRPTGLFKEINLISSQRAVGR